MEYKITVGDQSPTTFGQVNKNNPKLIAENEWNGTISTQLMLKDIRTNDN